ncbi:MAG: hypothetical protein JXA58_03420 [Dehalococcoidia bacterium]|nr:hypothetical protein [Dehalococcoidia bacterium]
MNKNTLRILPGSAVGWWSLGLIIAMPLLFFAGSSLTDSLYASVPSGRTILEDIQSRPALALTMLAGMVTGVAAFITGLLAIIRRRDTAILVYVSTAIGALFLGFLAGEIAFPH